MFLPVISAVLHRQKKHSTKIAPTMASAGVDDTTIPLPGNVLVISGNRGLGLEVVRHLKTRQSNVLATTRKTNADLEVNEYMCNVQHKRLIYLL